MPKSTLKSKDKKTLMSAPLTPAQLAVIEKLMRSGRPVVARPVSGL